MKEQLAQMERDALTALQAAQTALKALNDQAALQKKTAAEKLINDAIAAGKLDATKKEDWIKLALMNEELTIATLAAIPAKKSVGASISNPPAGATLTMEDFQKLSDADQVKFKNEQPDAYKALLSTLDK